MEKKIVCEVCLKDFQESPDYKQIKTTDDPNMFSKVLYVHRYCIVNLQKEKIQGREICLIWERTDYAELIKGVRSQLDHAVYIVAVLEKQLSYAKHNLDHLKRHLADYERLKGDEDR